MEKNNSIVDSIVYTICCVVTFGSFWLFRILITTAIRKAFEESK